MDLWNDLWINGLNLLIWGRIIYGIKRCDKSIPKGYKWISMDMYGSSRKRQRCHGGGIKEGIKSCLRLDRILVVVISMQQPQDILC